MLDLHDIYHVLTDVSVYHAPEHLSVDHICLDSRKATSTSIFVALVGAHLDARKFIINTIAPLVIVEEWNQDLDRLYNPTGKICVVQVPNARKALALLSCEIYDHPARKMCMIGITGTNGKTTTSLMISDILRQYNRKIGYIGTIGHQINGEKLSLQDGHTTPEAPELQHILSIMVEKGCTFCVMEVSSIGLDMFRVFGIEFDVVAFTNFTQDHLDFHANMHEYLQAKRKLFSQHVHACSISILHSNQTEIRDTPISKGGTVTFGTQNNDTWQIVHIKESVNKTHCIYRFAQELRKIEIPLIGRHNVENAITALACAYATGIPVFMIEKSLSRLAQIPGRLELVQSTTNSFYGHAFVDYAHTPDALEKALHSVRNICTGNVIVVFGCGGDRDKSKRPQMGHIAMQLADIVVITSDNPRSENPNAIIDDILQGIPTNSRDSVVSIIDRKEAIAYALCLLQENDVVLVAGKGHEDYQIIGTEKIHFDDREVIRNHQT